jgi:integrase
MEHSDKLPTGLYWRGNILWYTIRFNGRQYKESCHTDSPKRAQRCLNIKLGQLARGEVGSHEPATIRINELLDDFLANADQKLGTKTAAVYRYSVEAEKGIRHHFGKLKASKLTTKHTEDYRKARRLTGISDITVNRELAYLRAAFYLGKGRTPSKVSSVPKFDMVSEKNNVRTGFLTDPEYHILLSELPEYLKPLFVVAVNVAIRRGELLKIKWSQVNFEEGVITLNPWETKKQDIRNCPIVKGDMLDYLRRAEKDKDCPWVFSRKGEVIKDFKNAWERACNRASKHDGGENLEKLRFHDLRRAAVRNMRRAGVAMTVIMKISGHKTEAMHLRYNIVDLDDIQEAGRLMGVRQGANASGEMVPGAADLAARILALPEERRKLLAALL